MTNKPNSVGEEIDKIVGTFVSLKYDEDTDEYSDGTLERWNNMKRAITTILDQKIKEARIDEWKLISEVQHSAGITAELYFGEERDNRINQLTKEK
jgi:ribosome-binding factor A